jgi:7-keto-8-aminopelargonate synthetase-like enzyme
MAQMQSPPGAVTQIDGREYFYFAGTGYLGIQSHPEVIQTACLAFQQYGTGSANSRTVFGTTPPLLEVERLASRFFGLDDAFYFASGWMGNAILAGLFCEPTSNSVHPSMIFLDECSHYSCFEAARLTGFASTTFHHNDPDDLRAKIGENLRPQQIPIVLSDGVFAATGQIAPVEAYHTILSEYPGAILWLDDAHGMAVLGEQGRGTFEHAGLWRYGVNVVGRDRQGPHQLLTGTLSKAFGGFGGIIPGEQEFMRRVKYRSPQFAGASAPPPAMAAATAKAIEIVTADPSRRKQLLQNAKQLKDGLRGLGLAVEESPTPIACLTIGNAENMQWIQRELMQRGIAIAYMAAYSGLSSEGGLRIAVFATHTKPMIQQLLAELRTFV